MQICNGFWYPLPRTDEVLDTMARHGVCSFLDGFCGYHQILSRWTLSSALAVNIHDVNDAIPATNTLSSSAFSRVSTARNASYWGLSLLWRLQSGMESTNPLQVYGILLYIINFSPLQILLIFYRQYISPSLRRNSLIYEKEIGLYICPYIHQGKNIKCILVASKTSLWFQYFSLLTTMHV